MGDRAARGSLVIDPTTERRLLAALRGPDTAARDAAMGELHAVTSRALFQLCLRVACNGADAEDAVQETFVDLLRGVRSFRGDAKLTTWLFRIAIRAATRIRNRGAHRHYGVFDGDVAGEDDPVARAAERENAARLLAAIDELPAAQRAVIGLAAIQGIEHGEIAAVLGIPVGTVWSRLHEARERLRVLLAARPGGRVF